MRFLFACDYLVASGGLLRLERAGQVLNSLGHECAYLVFSPEKARDFRPRLSVLTPNEAFKSNWDAVMVPGAGFPDDTINAFERLRDPRFGLRVQMILNDQHVRPRFLRVNDAFAPDIVLFNNEHWPPGSYREFAAKQFHYLIGAVDTEQFSRRQSRDDRSWFVIGAQIAKNPAPLLEAMEYLPDDCIVRFFGFDRGSILPEASRKLGPRIEHVGPLFDADLARYYQDLDVMVSTEERAGWANVVAEAMASGVPAVTTPAGTLSIARHEETALVVPKATAVTLSAELLRLKDNPSLAASLADNARTHIERFNWHEYSRELIDLVRNFNGESHYLHAPELGLFGKTMLSERLDGLEPLLDQAGSFHSILDVGCAEAALANTFVSRGSKRVDAYDIDERRVAIGNRLFCDRQGLQVRRADLTRESDLRSIISAAPASGYDLTLYLGVHQHLPAATRLFILRDLLSITSGRIALRTPADTEEFDDLRTVLRVRGFELEYKAMPRADSFAGPLNVYRRVQH